MNFKHSHTSFLGIAMLALSATVLAQAPKQGLVQAPAQPVARPVVYSTAPKLAIAKLNQNGNDVYDVRGRVTYTVTAANSDDTIVGTINYSLPEDARQKLAELSGKPLAQIPSNVNRKEVLATFQKGTAPPIIRLDVQPLEFEVVGVKARLGRISLDITARENVETRYTKEEMEALFTNWARQINNGRARRGIIGRMNRVINGEEDQ